MASINVSQYSIYKNDNNHTQKYLDEKSLDQCFPGIVLEHPVQDINMMKMWHLFILCLKCGWSAVLECYTIFQYAPQ